VVLPNDVLLGEVGRLLREGHSVVLMTKGNSMLPFIRGDKDSVQLERSVCPAVGQAVLAEIRPGVYVLHRLIAVDSDNVTLHGDGNLRGDEHCRMENIAGVVTAIIGPGGRKRGPYDKTAAKWRKLPYIVRRIFLAFYRRLI